MRLDEGREGAREGDAAVTLLLLPVVVEDMTEGCSSLAEASNLCGRSRVLAKTF